MHAPLSSKAEIDEVITITERMVAEIREYHVRKTVCRTGSDFETPRQIQDLFDKRRSARADLRRSGIRDEILKAYLKGQIKELSDKISEMWDKYNEG